MTKKLLVDEFPVMKPAHASHDLLTAVAAVVAVAVAAADVAVVAVDTAATEMAVAAGTIAIAVVAIATSLFFNSRNNSYR